MPLSSRLRRGAASPARAGLLGSAAWSAADFWIQQAAALLVFIVLGNAVGPQAVGVLTMAQLAVTLAMTLLLDGFADALIQRERLGPAHFGTALGLLLCLGLGAGGLLLLAAAPLAALFGEPELRVVLPWLALGLPLLGLAAPYQALLQREMRFGALALRSLLVQGAGFAGALLMASAGYGVHALVGYFLLVRALDALLLPLIARRLPRPGFDRAALADILGFGKHRVGSQLLGFVVMQVDRFSAAMFLGPLALGLYSIAERITMALTGGLSGVMARIGFPAFSARQSDLPALNRALGDVLLLGNVLAVPAFVGIACVSHTLTGALLAPEWAAAAPVLAVLALGGIPHLSNYIVTAAVNARGRPDLVLRYSLVIMAMRLAASLPAASQGILWLAWANLLVTAASTLVVLAASRGLLPEAPRLVLRALGAPLLAATGMAAVIWAARLLLPPLAPVPALVVEVGVGAAAYAALLALVAPRAVPLLLRRAA